MVNLRCKMHFKEKRDMSIDDINSLTGIEFEHLCAELLQKLNFQVETTKASGDGGIDIVAYSNEPIFKGKYIVQCKRYSGTVGEPILRDLYGVITSERANKGILMTTGQFTAAAASFAKDKPIELIDGDGILSLLIQLGICIEKGNTEREPITIAEKAIAALKDALDRKEYVPEYNDIIIKAIENNPDNIALDVLTSRYATWIEISEGGIKPIGNDVLVSGDDLYVDSC